eukprot:4756414-Alexandrium_andersonii.AAC.1
METCCLFVLVALELQLWHVAFDTIVGQPRCGFKLQGYACVHWATHRSLDMSCNNQSIECQA